jgi:hypothetical protein
MYFSLRTLGWVAFKSALPRSPERCERNDAMAAVSSLNLTALCNDLSGYFRSNTITLGLSRRAMCTVIAKVSRRIGEQAPPSAFGPSFGVLLAIELHVFRLLLRGSDEGEAVALEL